jgi:nucleoid-associated protein YgaU
VRPAVLLRRRLAVSAVLFLILAASMQAVRLAAGLLGSAPPATSEQVPAVRVAPVSRVTHLVEPGDTLWQIARRIQPTGDVRPLVDRLTRSRHGRALQVGEVVVIS